MADNYMGQILQGAWTFAPRGTMYCSGQIMSISQNTALFSLLGTNFGGDGQQTFGLPNLQGRVPIHVGNGAGLQTYVLGEMGGTENTTLSTANLPAHIHTGTVTANGTATLKASSTRATDRAPSAGAVLAFATDGADPPVSTPEIYLPAGATADQAMGGLNLAGATVTVGPTGNNQPISVLQPFLAIAFVIVTQGIFPSRN